MFSGQRARCFCRKQRDKDDKVAIDSIKKYAVKEAFVKGNKDNYTRACYESLRDVWQKETE